MLDENAREQRREYMRHYREKNRERINENARRWRAENPEKVRVYIERYWARKSVEAADQS